MIPIIVNTTPAYHDAANIFLHQKRRYAANYKVYIFSENASGLNLEHGDVLIQYKKSNFRDEYLSCLAKVQDEYVITSNDDYFFNGYPNNEKIMSIIEILNQKKYSFVRMHRGYNDSSNEIFKNLFALNPFNEYYYTQGLTIWRRCDLEKLFFVTPPSGIARKKNEVQFEIIANKFIKQLGLEGLYFYEAEKKRGLYHYDCSLMPHLASAIVDGKWNFAEYDEELSAILKELNVDIALRGKYSFSAFSGAKEISVLEILNDISLEIKDTNSNHWHFGDFTSSGSKILMSVGYRSLSEAYKKGEFENDRRYVLFNNWAPCEYAQNPVIDSFDAVEAEAKFDYVLSICPYTTKWRNANTSNPRHIYAFYPYSEKIIPTTQDKIYDVIYHGGIHGKEHISALRVMRDFNYRYSSLSYGINRLTQQSLGIATDIDLPFEKKIELIGRSKISIAFNQIHVSPRHLWNMLKYKDKLPQESSFFNCLKYSGIFSNYPWVGVLPQFKTRIHEAAISKTINLVKRDAWNVIENYYVPGKEFIYFDNEDDLRSKILFILKNWNSEEINNIIGRAFKKSQRYTTKNFVEYYDKILIKPNPVNFTPFSDEKFWI